MTAEEFANYIISKTVRRIELNISKLPLFKRYIVYMAVNKKEALYVGMSTNGLSRVFTSGHHIFPKIYNEIDKIEIYETATEKDALDLEMVLIREFRPKYNDRGYAKKSWNAAKIEQYIANAQA